MPKEIKEIKKKKKGKKEVKLIYTYSPFHYLFYSFLFLFNLLTACNLDNSDPISNFAITPQLFDLDYD